MLDITSKRWLKIEDTLVDRISRDFSRIKLRKVSVKVPKLRIKKNKIPEIKRDKIPVSLIVNILLKNAVDSSKAEKKEKSVEKNKTYVIKKDEKELMNGGYGTVSKSYGSAPRSSYVDYAKLFSYLEKFRAQGYGNFGEEEFVNKSLDDKGFSLVDTQTMEKGKTYLRYFNSKTPIDKSSLVPIAGMNSAEWESFKMWMRLDTAMYLLKISTS